MNLEDYRRIQDLIDGDAAPVERDRLLDRLERDGETAREFEESLAIEGLLLAAHGREPNLARIAETLRARMPARRRLAVPGWLAAAAGFAIAVLGSLALAERARTDAGRVVGGGLSVAGAAIARVPYGEIVRSGAASGGAIRLRDGSRIALGAGSAVIVRAPNPAEGRRVELLDGEGEFTVAAAPLPFSVWTESGRIVVTGTQFAVRLLPDWRPSEGNELAPESPTPMEVAVTRGSVRVEFQNNEYPMASGDRRVFAVERTRRAPPAVPEPPPLPAAPPVAPPITDDPPPPSPRTDWNDAPPNWKPDDVALVRQLQGFVAGNGDAGLSLKFAGRNGPDAQTVTLPWAENAVVWVEEPAFNAAPTDTAPTVRRRRGTPEDVRAGTRVTVQLGRYGINSIVVHGASTE